MLWFWVFMLIVNLLIPVTMLGFGWSFQKRPPKQIGEVFGYRTAMSTKNKDTWAFAHRYFGRIWFVTGCVTAIAVGVVFVLLLGKSTETVGKVGGAMALVQCALLVAPILPTEIAMRKTFDRWGNHK